MHRLQAGDKSVLPLARPENKQELLILVCCRAYPWELPGPRAASASPCSSAPVRPKGRLVLLGRLEIGMGRSSSPLFEVAWEFSRW
jgi:hypothetical protein